MYNKKMINDLVGDIYAHNGINDKSKLTSIIKDKYSLIKDRSVFFCDFFAIRFCKSNKLSYGNTVLARVFG